MAKTEYLVRDIGKLVEPRSSLGKWVRHVDYYTRFYSLPMASSAGDHAVAVDGVVVVLAVVAAVPG